MSPATLPGTKAPASQGTTTLNYLLRERVRAAPAGVALRRKVAGRWEDITWQGYYDAATKVGLALLEVGLERGQSVAIISQTRAEWAFCDLGILGALGVTVPIYQSSVADDVAYIVEDSGARVLFVEDLDQWRKVRSQLPRLASVERFVIFDTSDTQTTRAADAPFAGDPRVLDLDAFLALGEGRDRAAFEQRAASATPEDVVTLIYTSGTTGRPKGVILTHGNALAECLALDDAIGVGPEDLTLAFLPLAHVFARALHWHQLHAGFSVAFAQDLTRVVDDMSEVRPTFFAAVPRIYEKIHQGVLTQLQAQAGLQGRYARWAMAAGLERERRRAEQGGPGFGPGLRCALGGLALKKLRARLQARTGGRVRFFISGGAPLSREVAYFLTALGFQMFEGYGLTETTAATHLNRAGATKLGSVGRTVAGVSCKLAADGEVLVQGPVVMRGYHGRPEDTAEVLREGWFHTGDIGEIDADGFLRITDRKKDLLITAAGKNIAPQNVENHVKAHPLISQVALFGDRQKYCVALLTIDEPACRRALEELGETPPASYEELSRHPRLAALLDAAVAERNAALPSYETIKKFAVLPKDFEVGIELTPTLKVKRKVLKERYGHLVDALYASGGAG